MTDVFSQSDPEDAAAPYGLEGGHLARPDLPGAVVAVPAVDELIDHVAADMIVHAENCVREFGDFHVALSGAAVFERLYVRLMYDPSYRRLPWRRTHLWFVEDLAVPGDDERSAFRMINETLGEHADIPPEQFHRIFAESETADVDYESQIRDVLGWREKGQDRFDYVLLSMGAGGTTEGAKTDNDVDRLVLRSGATDPGTPARVALTFPFINAARFVAVFVTGEANAAVVRELAAGEAGGMPIAVAPINGELKWYLDADACAGDEQ